MKKRIWLLLLVLCMSGCGSDSEKLIKYQATTTESGFDTPITFIAYTDSQATFQKQYKKLQKAFLHYHQLFDKYHNYDGINNIKTINDQAGIAPVKVDGDIIAMLQLAKTYYEASNAHFDITMGSVLNIWHDVRTAGEKANDNNRSGVLPDMQQLQEAKVYTGFAFLEIDEAAQTVYLSNAQVSLDVGAIAKGYATEKVAKQLQNVGLNHAIINAGGNVRIIGKKPDSESWSVGVQSPNLEDSASLASVTIEKDGSFVTSGDYQRYYLVDGEMIHHIIDPETLFPANHHRAVTVITPDSGVADALSTTLFTLPYEDGYTLIKNLQAQGLEIEAIWVYDKQDPAPKGVKTYPAGQYDLVITPDLKKQIRFN